MQIEVVESRDLTLISDLCVVWNSSVRATHDFLAGEDILQIERYVPTALKGVPDLVVARGSLGEPIGFMGVNDCTLEMLFVSDSSRGMGVGKRLLEYGIERLGVRKLTVNEQNPLARGFYEHLGFEVYDRSDVDEQGMPFPLLYMRLRKKF